MPEKSGHGIHNRFFISVGENNKAAMQRIGKEEKTFMKVLGRNVSLRDLVPPIAYKLMRRMGVEVNMEETYFSPSLHSYSQFHEDLIIRSIFNGLGDGFYVDVGANHPSFLSNTKRFYDDGWHGINIEPNPHLLEAFNNERPRDINLNIGIGNAFEELDFYRMSADTLSTFSKKSAVESGKIHKENIVDVIQVQVMPLASVFDEYCVGQSIDLLSVDVEGYDLAVLQSNIWDKFRPKALIVEINQDERNIVEFLERVDYEMAYLNHTNGIFLDAGFVQE